jgi:hypothetical protein
MWRRHSCLRVLAAFQPPVPWNTGLESPVNPQVEKPALRKQHFGQSEAPTFLKKFNA